MRDIDVQLEDDEMLVSYDIKSLFTSVPVNESIDIWERRLYKMDHYMSEFELSYQ